AERSPDSMSVGYVRLGRDDAIAGNYIDLKIKNNTGYPVYLDAYASNGVLQINLYGHEVHEAGR
ncbi:VanW family protein, partial [Anaerotignum propionicum]|uniref:VanW family protein n=1 Tax=Anaerotignum propionicum TaxID=28446 RepID=UPI00210EC64C